MKGQRQKLSLKERRKRAAKKEQRAERREQAQMDHLQSVIAPQSKLEVAKDLTRLRRRK